MTNPTNHSMDDGVRNRRSLEHRRHDLDLIAAHADDQTRESTAAALIASCDGCRAEYELQRRVRTWLAQAAPVQLSDDERTLLHERVTDAVTRPAPVIAGRRNKQPGKVWLRIGAVAAGLAAVVALAGLLPPAGAPGESTTSIQLAAPEAGGDEGAPTTTAAAGETMLAASDASRTRLPGGDAKAVEAEIAALMTTEPDRAGYAREGFDRPACLAALGGIEPINVAESTLDGDPIIIFVVPGEPGPEALVFRVDSCEPVDLG